MKNESTFYRQMGQISAKWRMRVPSIDRWDKLVQMVMVFNATFNNISVTSWWFVLLVEETGENHEYHRSVESHWQTVLLNVVSNTPHLRQVWQIRTYWTVCVSKVIGIVNKCNTIFFSFPEYISSPAMVWFMVFNATYFSYIVAASFVSGGKSTFSGSLACPLYIGLTVAEILSERSLFLW